MTISTSWRLGAIAALLLAGSCAAPRNDATVFVDGARNYPITVAPDQRHIEIAYAGDALQGDEARRLDAFVADYRSRGIGSITLSAPAGPGAPQTIRYFGERLAQLGIDRGRIMVGTHGVAGGDSRVRLGYVTHIAQTKPCENWNKNLADNASNLPTQNFGCATQHNIAAMVADPRDLLGPRPMSEPSAARRTGVIGKYEKGETTGATKSSEQSGSVSQISQ